MIASFCEDSFALFMQQLVSAVEDALESPPPPPPGPDAAPGNIADAGEGCGSIDGPGGCGCTARGDHAGSVLLGLALLALLSRRRRAR